MQPIQTQQRIEALLARYYEAQTTPSEELELYALLLDQRPGDAYYTDALVLRAQYEGEASAADAYTADDEALEALLLASTPRAIPSPAARPRWMSVLAAASVLLTLATAWWQIDRSREQTEPQVIGWRNGLLISEDDAREELRRALGLVNRSFAIGHRAHMEAMQHVEKSLMKSKMYHSNTSNN